MKIESKLPRIPSLAELSRDDGYEVAFTATDDSGRVLLRASGWCRSELASRAAPHQLDVTVSNVDGIEFGDIVNWATYGDSMALVFGGERIEWPHDTDCKIVFRPVAWKG